MCPPLPGAGRSVDRDALLCLRGWRSTPLSGLRSGAPACVFLGVSLCEGRGGGRLGGPAAVCALSGLSGGHRLGRVQPGLPCGRPHRHGKTHGWLQSCCFSDSFSWKWSLGTRTHPLSECPSLDSVCVCARARERVTEC